MLRIRYILVLLLVSAGLCAYAARTDSLDLTDVPPGISELNYHLRLKVARNRPLIFDLLWNYFSDKATRCARIEVQPPSEAGTDGRCRCEWRITDGESVIDTGEALFEYSYGGETAFSTVLSVDKTGACLNLGSEGPEVHIPVPFARLIPGRIGARYPASAKVLTNMLITRSAERQRSTFRSLDSLTTYLKQSTDALEGVWEYLDRDVDASRAAISTGYRLATVANPQGGYDIIYLGPETGGEDGWHALDIKGRMTPTPFIDHFDLSWHTADGLRLTEDTSASYEVGRAVLKFSFPLLKSAVRFRRMLPAVR